MDSTLSQPQIDPVEEALSRIAQIARDKDRQTSASDSELFSGRRIIVPSVGHKIPPSEPTGDLFPKERRSRGRRAAHALARFCIAACIGVAATLAGQTYGRTALRATATWVPQLSWLSSLPPTSSAGTEPALEEPASAIEASATDPTGQAPQAVEPPGDMMPAARPAAPSAELLQQLETMGRDIAAVRQMVEQLTASPEHNARDISNLQESGRRTLGPPRPATKTRKPLSVLPEPQSGPESSSAPLPITAASPPAH